VWQNTYGQEVMINAQTLAMAKGFCSTWTVPLYGPLEFADGSLSFRTEFDIFELWNSPFTSPLLESGQSAEFASTWVDWVRTYYFDTRNASSRATVLRTWPLQHEGLFTVPVDGKVVFLVSFLFLVVQGLFDAEIGSGADFSTDGNFVMCPFVWINVLTPN
jgi:hypothetical protein